MRRVVAIVIVAACWLPVALKAEVVKFDLLERAPAFAGRSFGDVGPYERITARATIALEPADDHNAIITDLRSERGDLTGSEQAEHRDEQQSDTAGNRCLGSQNDLPTSFRDLGKLLDPCFDL
jgi:hypothetical protein